jgi:hypothetical protein
MIAPQLRKLLLAGAPVAGRPYNDLAGDLCCGTLFAEDIGAQSPGFLVTVAGADFQCCGELGSGPIRPSEFGQSQAQRFIDRL